MVQMGEVGGVAEGWRPKEKEGGMTASGCVEGRSISEGDSDRH